MVYWYDVIFVGVLMFILFMVIYSCYIGLGVGTTVFAVTVFIVVFSSYMNLKTDGNPIFSFNTAKQENIEEKIIESTTTANIQRFQVIPEITYEPAELVECVELEDGTYEMLFAVGESEVQLFSWIDTYIYPDDTPYLLTMDNKGTLNNPLDDEILVVWKDMN